MSSKRLSPTRPTRRRLTILRCEELEARRLLAIDAAIDLDDSLTAAEHALWPAADEPRASGGQSSATASLDALHAEDGAPWNLLAVEAPQAWDAGHTGRGVVVAIVDSGIHLGHPDLVDSVWSNTDELPGNGRDDDGNGFVDDVVGWDFVDADSLPDDPNGHGTHIAGTVAARGDAEGVTGVAPDALVMAVRVLDARVRGDNRDIAAGIRYATDNGARIINLSVAGERDARLEQALEYARQHDVLVIAASGNTKGGATGWPAAYSRTLDNVLAVSAYREGDTLAQFSSRVGGSGAVQVDAPGQNIRSTFVAAPYGWQSGTSMSAPHVAGLAALALSANPALTAAELREVIIAGAEERIVGSDSHGAVRASATVALAEATVRERSEVTNEQQGRASQDPRPSFESPPTDVRNDLSDFERVEDERSVTRAQAPNSDEVVADERSVFAHIRLAQNGLPPASARRNVMWQNAPMLPALRQPSLREAAILAQLRAALADSPLEAPWQSSMTGELDEWLPHATERQWAAWRAALDLRRFLMFA